MLFFFSLWLAKRFIAETRVFSWNAKYAYKKGRTYLRPIFSEPKFLGCIDNKIFLPLERCYKDLFQFRRRSVPKRLSYWSLSFAESVPLTKYTEPITTQQTQHFFHFFHLLCFLWRLLDSKIYLSHNLWFFDEGFFLVVSTRFAS